MRARGRSATGQWGIGTRHIKDTVANPLGFSGHDARKAPVPAGPFHYLDFDEHRSGAHLETRPPSGAPLAADPQTQPYSKKIAPRGIWVEPELLVEIECRAKSAEGEVRHPFFKGLREDL